MEVKVGKVYRHFRGNLYLIEGIATDSVSDEKVVVYRALYGNCDLYVRPYDMFVEKVDKKLNPFATQDYVFQLIEITSDIKDFSL